MAELRMATSPFHQALDSDPRMAAYFQSREELARLLGRWYGFMYPFEGLLRRSGSRVESLLKSRSKVQLLFQDLQAHGIDGEKLPVCAEMPDIHNEDEAWGAMYVTEGATLGGQLLSRGIEHTLKLSNGVGYSFFRSYGSETGSRWREFGSLVEKFCSESREVTIEAARRTFQSIHPWLVGGF